MVHSFSNLDNNHNYPKNFSNRKTYITGHCIISAIGHKWVTEWARNQQNQIFMEILVLRAARLEFSWKSWFIRFLGPGSVYNSSVRSWICWASLGYVQKLWKSYKMETGGVDSLPIQQWWRRFILRCTTTIDRRVFEVFAFIEIGFRNLELSQKCFVFVFICFTWDSFSPI